MQSQVENEIGSCLVQSPEMPRTLADSPQRQNPKIQAAKLRRVCRCVSKGGYMKQKLGSSAIHRHMADPKRPAIIGLSEDVYNNNLRYYGLQTDSRRKRRAKQSLAHYAEMTTSPRVEYHRITKRGKDQRDSRGQSHFNSITRQFRQGRNLRPAPGSREECLALWAARGPSSTNRRD